MSTKVNKVIKIHLNTTNIYNNSLFLYHMRYPFILLHIHWVTYLISLFRNFMIHASPLHDLYMKRSLLYKEFVWDFCLGCNFHDDYITIATLSYIEYCFIERLPNKVFNHPQPTYTFLQLHDFHAINYIFIE